jgi:hypothetical protein
MKTRHFCSSGNSINRLNISLGVAALLMGGIIYALFRTSQPFFFKWIPGAGSESLFNLARQRSLAFSLSFPEWIVFSLPNGLWAFAYALLITGIWAGSQSWIRVFWLASIPVLVLGFEILQFTGTLPGIFCMQDIALGIAGLIIGIFVGRKTINPNHYEKAID